MWYVAFFYNGARYRIHCPSFKKCWHYGLGLYRHMLYKHYDQEGHLFQIMNGTQCYLAGIISVHGITLGDGRMINRRCD